MTRWLIPGSVIALCLAMPLAMCAGHYRPILIENDTPHVVKFDISPYKILSEYAEGLPTISPIEPGSGFRAPSCSNEWEFAYLATARHPEVVAYRIRDICDPNECSCDIKISDLEKQRARLAVPWQMAGTSWSLSRKSQ